MAVYEKANGKNGLSNDPILLDAAEDLEGLDVINLEPGQMAVVCDSGLTTYILKPGRTWQEVT